MLGGVGKHPPSPKHPDIVIGAQTPSEGFPGNRTEATLGVRLRKVDFLQATGSHRRFGGVGLR